MLFDLMLKTINDYYMHAIVKKFSNHACQRCGAERKLVETIIDDEFYWDEQRNEYLPNKFTDDFEHTGNERCADCKEEWTGL